MADQNEAIQKAIASLLRAIDTKEQDVSQLDISASGIVRIFGIDRSLRTIRFDGLKRWKRDRDNRIIRDAE